MRGRRTTSPFDTRAEREVYQASGQPWYQTLLESMATNPEMGGFLQPAAMSILEGTQNWQKSKRARAEVIGQTGGEMSPAPRGLVGRVAQAAGIIGEPSVSPHEQAAYDMGAQRRQNFDLEQTLKKLRIEKMKREASPEFAGPSKGEVWDYKTKRNEYLDKRHEREQTTENMFRSANLRVSGAILELSTMRLQDARMNKTFSQVMDIGKTAIGTMRKQREEVEKHLEEATLEQDVELIGQLQEELEAYNKLEKELITAMHGAAGVAGRPLKDVINALGKEKPKKKSKLEQLLEVDEEPTPAPEPATLAPPQSSRSGLTLLRNQPTGPSVSGPAGAPSPVSTTSYPSSPAMMDQRLQQQRMEMERQAAEAEVGRQQMTQEEMQRRGGQANPYGLRY